MGHKVFSVSLCVIPIFLLSLAMIIGVTGDVTNEEVAKRLPSVEEPDASVSRQGNISNTHMLPTAKEVEEPCAAFYHEYIKMASSFSQCELQNAAPFRLCSKCIVEHAVVQSVYSDLMNEPELSDCKVRYTRSDRVQIIPTVQKNIEAVWQDADCTGCYSSLYVRPDTKEVNYTIPDEVSHFLDLYHNLSECLNMTLTDNFDRVSNNSGLCENCHTNYMLLNEHYNMVSDSKDGNVCMDMVDMMNHTRLLWSNHLNCSHRSGNAIAVIIITCIVGIAPIFFYGTLKITGKVRLKKIFKQKRLDTSHDSAMTVSQSFSQNSTGRPSQRLNRFT